MKIKNAIIILGPGKSGSTLLNHMFSLHPDLYWISTYVNKFPGHPELTVFNNIYRLPKIENLTREKSNFPRPAEAFYFWTRHIKTFWSDKPVSTEQAARLIKALDKIRKYQSGNRLLIKLTGPTPPKLIESIFEDPHIIWLDRDPRATIASYYANKWLYKNRPEVFASKSNLELIKEYTESYKKSELHKGKFRDFKFLEVSYEDLTEEPTAFLKKICEFTNLPYPSTFHSLIIDWDIKAGNNMKYQKLFTPAEITYMDKILQEKI
ncbi:sulfotransferase family protein [Salegentibacter flavus]|uniref:Sulfotransferase domain-containing protein n=1 Tax=Salegentibacter flavus TaxID=287099 RepID=A0A1I4Y4E7_9FLAO|nr:sulfotransferase [Salegentibacter flavus]SFN32958.1 Sulfotransferase domain-containing protein [Salegentibacter flavus]